MLAKTWRLTVVNKTGVSVTTISVSGTSWEENVEGIPTYDAAPLTYISGTVNSGSYLQGSTQDNTAYSHRGVDFLATITISGTPSGTIEFYYEISPDSGTTWPDPGNSLLLYTTPSLTSSGTFKCSFTK